MSESEEVKCFCWKCKQFVLVEKGKEPKDIISIKGTTYPLYLRCDSKHNNKKK